MNAQPGRSLRRALAVIGLTALGVVASPAAQAGACAGIAHCFDGGNFTANVTQVVVARSDGVTAYNTVRVTLSFRNTGNESLILAHRLGTNVLIDSNGNSYNYFNNRANRIVGIGIVQPGSADTQFQLAPGEARNATFENVIQYSPARVVLGNGYNFDLVIEQLALIGGQQVRTVRSHALSFPGLTRGAPGAAPVAAAPAPAAAQGPVAVVTAPAAAMPSTPAAADPAPAAPAVQPQAGAATDPCAVAPNRCVNAGPFIAEVGNVVVSNSGNVTAYQTVRITLNIRNTSPQPIVLGYKLASHVLVDDRGNRYSYFNNRPNRVTGIGIVQPGQADASFRLAPGQARSATFESVHQYNVRHTVMGNVYNFDTVLVTLEALSPTQVRSSREYALNFTNLRQGSAGSIGLPQGTQDAAAGVQKAVDFFKSLKR